MKVSISIFKKDISLILLKKLLTFGELDNKHYKLIKRKEKIIIELEGSFSLCEYSCLDFFNSLKSIFFLEQNA